MIFCRKNLNKKVLLIAEIGNNHEGNFSLAEKLIDLAAESGADAVKFQTFRAEHLVTQFENSERFNRLKSFEFNPEQFATLCKRAHSKNLLFISTPFDLSSVKVLEPLVDAYKISSGDNDFYPLIDRVAETKKPIIISAGLSTLEGLQLAKAHIRVKWEQLSHSGELAFLHCISSYPAPIEDIHLNSIAHMRKFLGEHVGYSDHSLGVDAAVFSVATGARIIEKHFTIDKEYSDFRDHALSADPKELRAIREKVDQLITMLGDPTKKIVPSEQANLQAMRRSIAVNRSLKTGHTLSREDLTWVRPGSGYRPGQESDVLGRTLSCHLNAGDLILEKSLQANK